MRLLEEEGFTITLNESPSEKEGKSAGPEEVGAGCGPSMKVPPKRKGNYGYAPQSRRFTEDPQ